MRRIEALGGVSLVLLLPQVSMAGSDPAVPAGSPAVEQVGPKVSEAKKRQQETARKLGMPVVFRDRFKEGGYGPEMVIIPSGTFQMGAPKDEPGYEPNEVQHQVTIARPFAIGKYEVTVAEYMACVEARWCSKPQWFPENEYDEDVKERAKRLEPFKSPRQPMVATYWYGMDDYAEWLSKQTGERYRLATEAEWEYAARGGTRSAYYWGDRPDCRRAHYSDDACGIKSATAEVGSYPPNPFGLYDMAGNVWEWTCSRYEEDYNGQEKVCASADYILGDENNFYRTIKGGSWKSSADALRPAVRDWAPLIPQTIFEFMLLEPNTSIGARVVRELPPEPSGGD